MTQKQLTDAMTTQAALGRATGVVMERFHLGAGQAFELLTRVARINDITIEAVADRILDQPDPFQDTDSEGLAVHPDSGP